MQMFNIHTRTLDRKYVHRQHRKYHKTAFKRRDLNMERY